MYDLTAAIEAAAQAAPMPTFDMEPVHGRVLHIDGDYCAYYCAGSDTTSAGEARRNLLDRIERAKAATGAVKAIMHLSDSMCTKGDRFLVSTIKPYQGQRNAGRKPDNWQNLREFMEGYEGNAFQKKLWLNREADDGIAYVATAAARLAQPHVILTADKDMRMFPGIHLVWKTFQLVEVPYGSYYVLGGDGKVYGHKWFWYQMVHGDAADNIPGIERMGEVAAEEIVGPTKTNGEAFIAVADAYKKKYKDDWEDRFVEQACLLWMRNDKEAKLCDFVRNVVPGTQGILAAIERLYARVNEEKAKLEALKH